MTLPPARRLAAAVILIGGGMLAASPVFAAGAEPPSAGADSIAEAACYVFTGSRQCETVTVDDAENCVIKVLPRSLTTFDPDNAACLLDDIGTTKIFLGKVAAQTPMVANSSFRISGASAVQVVTKFDGYGAPVWEPRNSQTFALKGDEARTRAALETLKRLSADFCARPPAAAGASTGASGNVIGAKEAFRRAAEGGIVLVDIRHPMEWRQTGVGVHAIPITMHQRMTFFVKQLRAVADADKQKPVALICAEGVRSAHLQKALKLYGFPDVIDVREGMVGGKSGPGWIKSGLPVRPYAAEQASRK